MKDQNLHTYWLILFMQAYANFASCKVYYIASSLSASCPQEHCLTLSQFAASSNHYLGNDPNIHATLFLLPGNHSLDTSLTVSHTESFSMINTHNSVTVFVNCASRFGRLEISQTSVASFKGLHFIGCGGNRFIRVDQLILEGTIFQGLEGSGTALIMNGTSTAKITNSSFISNVNGMIMNQIYDRDLEIFAYSLGDLIPKLNTSATVGGAIISVYSNVWIDHSTFERNSANLGAAVYADGKSNISIHNCQYVHNEGNLYGSSLANILFIHRDCTVEVSKSMFNNNTAGGGMIASYNSAISIDDCIFMQNTAVYSGGAIAAYKSEINISRSKFRKNGALTYGGAIFTYYSLLHIANSTFRYNTALKGGVIFTSSDSLTIMSSVLSDNKAKHIAGVLFAKDSSLNVTDSMFSNNKAGRRGGVMNIHYGTYHINGSTFNNNTARIIGGVMTVLYDALVHIADSIFFGNKARTGGILHTKRVASLQLTNPTIIKNIATTGTMYFLQTSAQFTGNTTFMNNLGSIFTYNSNISFNGYNRFENCTGNFNRTLESWEGGVITAYRSNVYYAGVTRMKGNTAVQGGALSATESTVYMYGEATIVHNRATMSGGGIHLYSSSLEIIGYTQISLNVALRGGGGINAVGAPITLRDHGLLHLLNNSAADGGGAYLELNAKLYSSVKSMMMFTGNRAARGGALYVADETYYEVCTTAECFVQVLTFHDHMDLPDKQKNPFSLLFTENVATEQGSDVFGGLLDRCRPSPLAEVKHQRHSALTSMSFSGVTYLQTVSNIALDSIASQPVRVCFCRGGKSDCNYNHPPIRVKKGETFTVSLTAVDQVNCSVPANITSSLSSSDSGLGEGQQSRGVNGSCTDLDFNVFSRVLSDKITLSADGPCKDSRLSTRTLKIHYLECECPVGFRPSNSVVWCHCVCDPVLSPYITDCNSTTKSLVRAKTNSWITYINNTNSAQSGYVIFQNCPNDYCYPSTENVSLDLTHPNGADAQCQYNRTGVLCGACPKHLSLSLGSSRCLPCQTNWLVQLAVILVAAVMAGILLLTVLLVLNMTVAVGLINGLIFYANVVAASSSVYFPSPKPSFPKVFIAWLNLDIGFDVCFFDGLDEYMKTWIQLAFPVYIISLIAIVIKLSEHSQRFTRLIGRRDPVAALATLLLLSYTKMLSKTIVVLSFATLHYPDGSKTIVWLPDGNLKYMYLHGKHIALVAIAFLILLVGIPYTILLFFWQWLVRAPKWKVFKWTRNTKLNAFIATYHAPYSDEHRYWTGLLLFVRVVLYTVSAITASSDPQVPLVTTIFLISSLLLLKGIIGVRVYRKWPVDVMETAIYFNIAAFAAFSLYSFKTDNNKQIAVAYSSTALIFIHLVGMLVYHTNLLIKKKRERLESSGYHLLTPVSANPKQVEVTYSTVEISKPSPLLPDS